MTAVLTKDTIYRPYIFHHVQLAFKQIIAIPQDELPRDCVCHIQGYLEAIKTYMNYGEYATTTTTGTTDTINLASYDPENYIIT